MKRTFLAAILVFLVLLPVACGHHSSSSPSPIAFIGSDPAFDGDIAFLSSSGVYTITQISPQIQSVFAGIDPATNVEYRAFLDFPLTGSGGVPGTATIDSAYLDIVITNVILQSAGNTIPIRIELISIQSPGLTANDYDRTLQPALAFTTILPPIAQADAGTRVTIDVTSLMTEAQLWGLAHFQVRILEDLGFVTPGLIEINDTTASDAIRGNLAPFLSVSYH